MKPLDDKVALYDWQGNQISHKLRGEIEKREDLIGHAGILIIGDERKIYVTKPKHSLWPNQWAGSAAGLILYDELPQKAIMRIAESELAIRIKPVLLTKGFYSNNGIQRYYFLFYAHAHNDIRLNHDDIEKGKWADFSNITGLIKINACNPFLKIAFLDLKSMFSGENRVNTFGRQV